MKKYYLDCETGPLPAERLDKLMPEFEPAANLKDPEKIKASVEAKRTEWLAGAALRAITGQIIAVTIAEDDQEPVMHSALPEPELIQLILDLVKSVGSSGTFYTWNGNGFDLPWICQRSSVYRLKGFTTFTNRIGNRFFWKEVFVDARAVWAMYNPDYRDTSLAKVALALGVGTKEGNGADFAELLKADPGKALLYAKNDIILLRGVVQAMGI